VTNFVWKHSLIYISILQEMIEGTATYKVKTLNEPDKEGYFHLNYDGDIARVTEIENNKLTITQLDNEDIMAILSKPSHHMTLIERLRHDYGTEYNKKQRRISHKNKKHRKRHTIRHHNTRMK
jgi:hypothetical protein